MKDSFGRTVDYLRLSVTDSCNFRCVYCMEEQQKPQRGCSLQELGEIAAAAVRLGIRKIRLTGGEPLVRPGILELCRQLKSLEGLQELTMTTNGSLLPRLAPRLKEAGVDRLNISLDSLNPERFRRLTRGGELSQVLAGLEAAGQAGFRHTKLNTVLSDWNLEEVPRLVELTRERDITLRFIELMPMGVCAAFPPERFVSAARVLELVPQLVPAGTQGVSQLYRIPGWRGSVGLIRPMTCRFCRSCSRIRVTCDGKLLPCLHSSQELDLRGLRGQALEEALREGIRRKPREHRLTQGGSEAVKTMHQIGG